MEKEFLAICALLNASGIEYQASEHEPVFTSEEAARVRGIALRTGVKALVFRCKYEKRFEGDAAAEENYIGRDKKDDETENSRTGYILALVRADHRVDTKKLKEFLGVVDVSLATPAEVLRFTNCEIGSVHPFGNLMAMRTVMDRSILENEFVNFNAGLHTKSVSMRAKDLLQVARPQLVDIEK